MSVAPASSSSRAQPAGPARDADATPGSDAGHPSPHRHEVSPWTLGIAVAGSPAIWSLQMLLDVSIAGHTCLQPAPAPAHLSAAALAALPGVLLGISVTAVVLCLVVGMVAWHCWRATRRERPGSGHHLIESGDGRTRFLAMTGLMTSALFGVAIVFQAVSVGLVAPCAS